jgi:hypothetical protein
VCGGIPYRFLKLGKPKILISLALQMEVVYGQPLSLHPDFRNQRDSPAQALLKQADLGQEPSGAPEIRLVAKAD